MWKIEIRNFVVVAIGLVTSVLAFAGEGSGHSHDPAGDWKLIGIVLGAVILIGLGTHFLMKKK